MRGDIVYLELALTNVEETLSLYKEAFKWKITQSYLSTQLYYMFDTPSGGITGGFDANRIPSDEGVLIYLESENLDLMLETIQKNHTSVNVVQGKTYLSKEYGSFAIIKDPSGNKIGLFESSMYRR